MSAALSVFPCIWLSPKLLLPHSAPLSFRLWREGSDGLRLPVDEILQMTRVTVIVFGREYPEGIGLCHLFPDLPNRLGCRKFKVLVHQRHIRIVQIFHCRPAVQHTLRVFGEFPIEGSLAQRSDDKKYFLHRVSVVYGLTGLTCFSQF